MLVAVKLVNAQDSFGRLHEVVRVGYRACDLASVLLWSFA